jgi:ParB family chromosome partitioning protein
VEGTLAAGHARALLGSADAAFQESLAARAVREGLSVRAVEEAVRTREEGGAVPAPSTTRSPANRRPGFAELELLLADHLATRVKVEERGKRGRIVVEFADLDDLERIYRAMVEGGCPPSTHT